MIGIFGKNNQERKIQYRDGKYFFADTGQVVPEELQANLKTTVFKERGTVNNEPTNVSDIEELARKVQFELKAGNLQKPKPVHC